MKNLIILSIFLSSLAIADGSIYGDAYRFGGENHTGVLGLKGDHFGAELSFETGGLSLTNRQYLAFQNIEIGLLAELTNSIADNAKNYRVVDIEGGLSLVAKPYIKVGSEWFFLLSLDESNAPVMSVGFKLY